MCATIDCNEAMVDYCLDHQCNVNLQNRVSKVAQSTLLYYCNLHFLLKNGDTALHYAGEDDILSLARKLLVKGVADDTLINVSSD